MSEIFDVNKYLEDRLRERLAKEHGCKKEDIELGFHIELL